MDKSLLSRRALVNLTLSGTFLFPMETPLSVKLCTEQILAWKIPWTEEPGRLQSMGSPKVRHD